MAPIRETFVHAADGTRLYVRRREGSGPLTALLCDGIACDGFIWRYLFEDLAPIADVVHWNYRGHGRSTAPANASHIDLAAFVSDLEAVRGELHKPLLLIGHSMGCQLVLEGYRAHPEGIAGMVLLCGTAGRMTHTFKGRDALARALPAIIEQVEKSPRLARAIWSNVPPDVAARIALAMGEVDRAAIEPEDIVRYSEHVANLDLPMFLRMLQTIGDDTAEDMLGTIQVPVLVIAGELDTFTPTRLAEQLAAGIPESELVIESGATHVVPIERRERVRDHIHDFVRRRVLPRLEQ
jgi:pimeloyl-ACP methyl ester carboxylesterase